MLIDVRPMTVDDAESVAELSGQLGYETTPLRIQQRFDLIMRNPDSACFVAEREQTILGWVHVYGVHLLESESYAEICGLIVSIDARRQGIGRTLMAAAETWAREHNYDDVRLRSGLHRTDAHQFYASVGYELTKTSHMFRKVFK